MTQEEALEHLVFTIENDFKHTDYSRVTQLSKDYKFFITGKDIKDRLKRFNPREDEELFKQRCALTIPVAPAACGSLIKPFYKVARTQPLIEKILPAKKSFGKAQAEVVDRIKTFYGSETNDAGLNYFLKNRFVELSFWDPNSWVVVEFDEFDSKTEKARPRPFEVSCQDAVNFSIVNNIVQFLIVKAKIRIKAANSEDVVDGDKYTIYADEHAIVAQQTLLKENEADLLGNQHFRTVNEKSYIFSIYEHKAGKVPVVRIGYKRDLETDGRTFVSPLHDALCYLEKSIKQGSEFDLSTCLHTFPQKLIRLTKTCPGDGKQKCFGGHLADGNLCTNCKGTGKPVHTSGQDLVEVEIPETKDEYIPLTDYVYYVPLPIDLLKLQKQWLDDLKIDCHQAVFNSTVLIKKTSSSDLSQGGGTKTATEADMDMDSVYDTLNPFAEKISSTWSSFVELIAIFTDNANKVEWIHRFPTNFKLKSKEMLYQDLTTANNGNLPAFVKEAITDEIAEQAFVDDPKGIIRYRVQKMHYPFMGKSETEIIAAINSDLVLKETKVLYHYYDFIIDALEREFEKIGKDFYVDLDVYQRQQEIDKKVAEILLKLEAQTPKAVLYGARDEGKPDEITA